MPEPDDDREIADASYLFDDREPRTSPDRPPTPSMPEEPEEGERGYDLADPGTGDGQVAPRPAPASPAMQAQDRPVRGDRERRTLTPAPVDRIWSRTAEWGPAIFRIATVVVVTGVLVSLGFSPDRPMRSVMIVAAGGAIALLLSYPIAITLERPVRMTPEQAVRDYFAALSHHIPHYRRMWLLLSSAGRSAPEFSSYGEFRSYWSKQVSDLKRGKAGAMTPISVRIEDFKAEKSTGLDAIEASYSLSVFLRGRESEGSIHDARAETTLSRGPDRMWYLDDGNLPRP